MDDWECWLGLLLLLLSWRQASVKVELGGGVRMMEDMLGGLERKRWEKVEVETTRTPLTVVVEVAACVVACCKESCSDDGEGCNSRGWLRRMGCV